MNMHETTDVMINDPHPMEPPVFHDQNEYTEPQNPEMNSSGNENGDRHSANWTTAATSILLKLYADKIEMLETPKKKTAMWIAISENLKEYDIDMTSNQVRWKINALTQRYKQCLDSGQQDSFKYYKEMENIYGDYYLNVDESEPLHKKKDSVRKCHSKSFPETRSMIDQRKMRLANRIEAETTQSKIHLEKQWLEYLRKEEEHKLLKYELLDRRFKLREEELLLRKREIEVLESLEFKKTQIKAKEQTDILQIETEKCNLLRMMLTWKRQLS